jgi:L-amino acid N-acyltransferase YncA
MAFDYSIIPAKPHPSQLIARHRRLHAVRRERGPGADLGAHQRLERIVLEPQPLRLHALHHEAVRAAAYRVCGEQQVRARSAQRQHHQICFQYRPLLTTLCRSQFDGKVQRMPVTIRHAAITDAAEIARIHVETWRTTYPGIVPAAILASLDQAEREQSWRERIAEGNFPILLAVDDGQVIGFAAGGSLREPVDDYDAELYAIYVLKTERSCGAGRALCRAVASELWSTGLRRILVWVLAANPAVSFYEHLGGTLVARKTIGIGGATLPEIALGWPDIGTLADGR